MYLAQVEHWWLNDYVVCDCQCQCQWWTATYLCHLPWIYAVHQYLDGTSTPFPSRDTGTNRRQDTHSLSVGPVTVTVDSVTVVGAPLPASGFFEFARRTDWYIVGRTACWICWPTLYFRLYRSLRIESEGSDSENVLLYRERPLPHWAHCLLRSARAHTTASTFHACVKFNLVVNYSRSVFSVQFILFLRQSLCMCLVLWSKSNTKT